MRLKSDVIICERGNSTLAATISCALPTSSVPPDTDISIAPSPHRPVLRNNNRQRDKDVFGNIAVILPIKIQGTIRDLHT
jgi:hypothetical protein